MITLNDHILFNYLLRSCGVNEHLLCTVSSIDSSPGKVSLAPLTPTSNPRSGNLFEWGIRKDPPLGLPGAVNLHRDLVLYWTKGTAGCDGDDD